MSKKKPLPYSDLNCLSPYERIYQVVRQIPRGRVATYGQIAKIVDRCAARMVGYAMAALSPGLDVPWHRVINHKGEISARARGDGALRQRRILQAEGIRFDQKGRVKLARFRWPGPWTGRRWQDFPTQRKDYPRGKV